MLDQHQTQEQNPGPVLQPPQASGHGSEGRRLPRRQSKYLLRRSLLVAMLSLPVIASFSPPAHAAPDERQGDTAKADSASTGSPVAALEGDGLRVDVSNLDLAAGTVSGTLTRGGNSYPFQGRMEFRPDDTEIIRGTFTAQGQDFPFISTQQGDGPIIFETGSKKYTLRPVESGQRPQPVPVKPVAPNPLDTANNAPANNNAPSNTIPIPAGVRPPLIVEKKKLIDPDMGNIESHTVLVPQGWTLEGKPMWTMLGDVSMAAKVSSPDGAEVNWVPLISLAYTEVSPQLAAFMQQNGNALPQVGQRQMDGAIFMPVPRDIGEWIATQFISSVRKNLSNVRLISATPRPEAARAVIERNPSIAGLLNQMNKPPQIQGFQSRASLMVFEVALSYDQNGTRFREEFAVQLLHTESFSQSMPDNWTRSETGNISFYGSWRAPEASFAQQKPILATVFGSMQPTPLWMSRYLELQNQLMQIRAKGFADRQRLWRESQERLARSNDRSVSDMQMDAWRKKNATDDEIQRKTVNMLTEREDWRDTDGSTVKFDGYYNRGFSNGLGTYVLTDNASLKPEQLGQNFQEMNKLP